MPLVDLQDPEKGFLVDDILQLKVEIQVQVCTFPGSSSSSSSRSTAATVAAAAVVATLVAAAALLDAVSWQQRWAG